MLTDDSRSTCATRPGQGRPLLVGIMFGSVVLGAVIAVRVVDWTTEPLPPHLERGRQIYMQTCYACHQPNGRGLPGIFPPLAGSDYLAADKERSIRGILFGQRGEITVNGRRYNGFMPPVPLSDEQAASVLTYVRNAWGNSGDPVTVEEVAKVRAAGRPLGLLAEGALVPVRGEVNP